MLNAGDKAPDFSLSDQDGNMVTLSSFSGSKVIIFFYSKDSTPGCTRQALGFSKSIEKYNKLGIKVIGISKDSVESHKRFSKRYDLKITLLSDPDREVIKKYDALTEKKKGDVSVLSTVRSSFFINEEGIITDARYKVKADTNSGELLEFIEGKSEREF